MKKDELTDQIIAIIKALKKSNQTISFAESCTGGLLVSKFTAISGVSRVLNGSVVSYSNEIKHRWLGVETSILEQFGAVSRECVAQMLIGIQKMTNCDYAIAISGIAGPTGATITKPVGTVYIGMLSPNGNIVHHCLFEGDRVAVQNASVDFAVKLLAKEMKIIF
ncbi:MAG: CinA family protein [Sulfurovaceae bacterium]|nr:CinA family protein [Sulfurovaceae bacterium]